MAHPPMIYGLRSTGGEDDELTYAGAAGRLPGTASAFSAGVLLNMIALDGNDMRVAFENDGIDSGWSLVVKPSAVNPAVLVATLSFGVVGPLTDVVTVPIGACGSEWLFVSFIISDNEGTPQVTVFVNGEIAYQNDLNEAIIPSVEAPTLSAESAIGASLVAWAYYTEGTELNATIMALLNAQLKKNAGTIDWTFTDGVVPLQHIYSATESMRPITSDVWADTGSTPNANLTRSEGTAAASVLPGDFAQAVIGAIVDPEGPATP